MPKSETSLAWMNTKESMSGEPVTGFEKAGELGPFNCGNCIHMSDEVCIHPIMVKLSAQPKKDDGVEVDADDCCSYVRRKGETKNGAKESQ